MTRPVIFAELSFYHISGVYRLSVAGRRILSNGNFISQQETTTYRDTLSATTFIALMGWSYIAEHQTRPITLDK